MDVDDIAMRISLNTTSGAIVHFDFKTAFPSLSFHYMMEMLELISLPRAARSFISALYFEQRRQISLAGGLFPGFEITSGIRQGCPLSPLLFAAVTDLLLRTLALRFPSLTARAFADDTADVASSFTEHADALLDVFSTLCSDERLAPEPAKNRLYPPGF